REVRAPDLRKKLSAARPLPGHNLSREEREARKRIQAKVADVESFLFQDDLRKAREFVFMGKTTCGLCHHYQRTPGAVLPARILPIEVPEVWYPHATFSHRAHRAVECRHCHEGAEGSTKHTDVLLPGVANCQGCHAPASGGP